MKSDVEMTDRFPARNERTLVASPTQMRHSNWFAVEVSICNVSQDGFMAQCEEAAKIGSYVSLDVPGIGRVRAQVRWQTAGKMGGMFLDPISLSRCEWTGVKTAALD